MPIDLDIVAQATDLAYKAQVVGNSSGLMPGFAVDRVFDDLWDNTGFYAVGFFNRESGDTLVGIRGSHDKLDMISDANLGVSQYRANRTPLIDYIGTNLIRGDVTIAGHSLGGGLSQYLGYDAAREFPGFRERLTVHTHNGFGGVAGIVKMHGGYERDVITGVRVRNFRHPDDPVSRIGGQMGGNVFNLADADPSPDALFYAHSNKRFLPTRSLSPLSKVAQAADDAFELAQTLADIAPSLSAALAQIMVRRDDPVAAVRRILRLWGKLGKGERNTLLRMAGDMLPLRRMVDQVSRKMPGRKRRDTP